MLESETQENLELETAEPASEDNTATAAESEVTAEDSLVEVTSSEPVEFVDSFQLLSILESIFFASPKPVSLATIKQIFINTNVETRDIKNGIEQLQVMLADPTRGVSLEEVVGGWQLRTKLDNLEFMKRLGRARPFRLSGPALEVLSIIAYKQPIIKNEVDQIRGVESGHLVRALMEKGLVNFQGKTDLPGKPMTYGTTRKFLEIFNLRSIEELPSLAEIDQLLPEGIGDEEQEKETLSSVTEGMSQAYTGSYSEGEEELLDITEKLGTISTSSDFFEEEKRRQKEKRGREKAEDLREALAVGELIEDKDRRWLERYESQQILAQQAAEQAQNSQAAASVGEALSEVAEQSMVTSGEEAAIETVIETNVVEAFESEDDGDVDTSSDV